MARPNVPKFGNWESQDNMPFTVCFDNARKAKGVGGKMINPNDPQENPDLFRDPSLLAPAPAPTPTPPSKSRNRSQEQTGRRAVRPTPDHNKGEDDFKQFNNSPPRNESNHAAGRGQRGGRSTRTSIGSEQSVDRSPLHHQAKVTGGSSGSPAYKGRNQDASRGLNGRSRLRAASRDGSPDNGATVPPFGEWNENDPQSAENFTGIFNKVKAERNANGNGNLSGTPNRAAHGQRTQNSNETKKQQCCFL